MNNKKINVSPEAKQQALAMAKATQKPNQSKEQTKLIAQGIEKGIAEFKKRQKEKSRDLDKKIKQVKRQASHSSETKPNNTSGDNDQVNSNKHFLPWGLLALSWLGFVSYFIMQG